MAEGKRFCENCGTEIGETTNFCPSCGAAQRPNPEMSAGPPGSGQINTPNAPGVPPPPEAQPKGSCLRTTIISLVVIIVLIIAVRTCGGEPDTSTSSSSAEQKEDAKEEVEPKEAPKEEPKEEPEELAGVGDTVTVGDIEWTATSARQANQLTQQGIPSEFAKTEQGNFVIVDFDFTNNSNEAVTLNTESLALVDSEGRESGPSSEAFLYTPEERQIFLERVNPGVTKQGQAIFEVAPGASGFQLQAGDARMFTDENVYIDLGF